MWSKQKTFDFQVRVNSLNFPRYLKTDGIYGPLTQEAHRIYGDEVFPSKYDELPLTRIHWHWTGGKYGYSDYAAGHYNYLVDEKGKVHKGKYSCEDQVSSRPAYHTKNANTGAIGIALTGMWNAHPNKTGKYPITWASIDSMLKLTRSLCEEYDIRVSPWTTLSHAEVDKNLGIKQSNKWDIRFLPDYPNKLLSAAYVGGVLRARLRNGN